MQNNILTDAAMDVLQGIWVNVSDLDDTGEEGDIPGLWRTVAGVAETYALQHECAAQKLNEADLGEQASYMLDVFAAFTWLQEVAMIRATMAKGKPKPVKLAIVHSLEEALR